MRSARVLFVCTGNICRSPTAEAVFRKAVADAGLSDRIECDSAGMAPWHAGKAPDPRAVRAAFQRGYEMVELRGRHLGVRDYSDFDLLIGMDSGHVKDMARKCPRKAKGQVALFLDFSPELAATHGADVPDPYAGDEADFEFALDLIEAGVPNLLAAVEKDYL